MCTMGLSVNSQGMLPRAYGAQSIMLTIPDVFIVIQILCIRYTYSVLCVTRSFAGFDLYVSQGWMFQDSLQ